MAFDLIPQDQQGYYDGVARENNTVLFDQDHTTGTGTARTGDVLVDLAGARPLAVTVMIHNDASAFGFFEDDGTTPFVFAQEIGDYVASVDNFLEFQFLGNGKVRLFISQ